MTTVPQWRPPVLRPHSQISPGFCHDSVRSPQLHLIHRCTSHASLSAWPVVGSYRPGGFFLWDYIFKRSLCSCIWFLHVSDSIYSFPFCYLYYIIFCTSFHLGVDYTLPLLISLPKSTQTAHRLSEDTALLHLASAIPLSMPRTAFHCCD